MDKWLNTTAALKCWLVFLIGFTLSGYRVEVAIALGALGGISGGFISSWWKAKGSEVVPQPDTERVVVLMRRFKERIEDQLGLISDERPGRPKSPKMGFFRVRDPHRGDRKRYRSQTIQDGVNDDSVDSDDDES